jgi:hypothetical protein
MLMDSIRSVMQLSIRRADCMSTGVFCILPFLACVFSSDLRDDLKAATSGSTSYFHKFETFSEALAWYIVRGDNEAMKVVKGINGSKASSVEERQSYGMLLMLRLDILIVIQHLLASRANSPIKNTDSHSASRANSPVKNTDSHSTSRANSPVKRSIMRSR